MTLKDVVMESLRRNHPDKKNFFKAYGEHWPRAVCRCLHSGDGQNSQHTDSLLANGHGPCVVAGCKCDKFSWADWTQEFAAELEHYK